MPYEDEVRRTGMGKNDSMDPTGQFYLPGYFCPAALIHSREITQDMGRLDTGTETTQRLLLFRLTEVKSITTVTTIKLHELDSTLNSFHHLLNCSCGRLDYINVKHSQQARQSKKCYAVSTERKKDV